MLLCRFMWVFRLCLCANRRSHFVHWNLCSFRCAEPVCCFNPNFEQNCSPHSTHKNFLRPSVIWVVKCCLILFFVPNVLLQVLHSYSSVRFQLNVLNFLLVKSLVSDFFTRCSLQWLLSSWRDSNSDKHLEHFHFTALGSGIGIFGTNCFVSTLTNSYQLT